jgi:hypothetical protein
VRADGVATGDEAAVDGVVKKRSRNGLLQPSVTSAATTATSSRNLIQKLRLASYRSPLQLADLNPLPNPDAQYNHNQLWQCNDKTPRVRDENVGPIFFFFAADVRTNRAANQSSEILRSILSIY